LVLSAGRDLRVRELILGEEPILQVVAMIAAAVFKHLEGPFLDSAMRGVDFRRCRLAGWRVFTDVPLAGFGCFLVF